MLHISVTVSLCYHASRTADNSLPLTDIGARGARVPPRNIVNVFYIKIVFQYFRLEGEVLKY